MPDHAAYECLALNDNAALFHAIIKGVMRSKPRLCKTTAENTPTMRPFFCQQLNNRVISSNLHGATKTPTDDPDPLPTNPHADQSK